MTSNTDARDELLTANRQAVEVFSVRARELSDARWTTPRGGERSWSPAQYVAHVTLAYRFAARSLSEGYRAPFVGTALQRRVWRLLGLSKILLIGKLPAGAPAPRDLRPTSALPPRAMALSELEAAVAELEAAYEARPRKPEPRIAHPYFGDLTPRQLIKVLVAHTRHHTPHL